MYNLPASIIISKLKSKILKLQWHWLGRAKGKILFGSENTSFKLYISWSVATSIDSSKKITQNHQETGYFVGHNHPFTASERWSPIGVWVRCDWLQPLVPRRSSRYMECFTVQPYVLGKEIYEFNYWVYIEK